VRLIPLFSNILNASPTPIIPLIGVIMQNIVIMMVQIDTEDPVI
jgi:hypothetical protein